MDIQKIQSALRQAVSTYEIQANIDAETLVAFLAVDIVRGQLEPTPVVTPRIPTRNPAPRKSANDNHEKLASLLSTVPKAEGGSADA